MFFFMNNLGFFKNYRMGALVVISGPADPTLWLVWGWLTL